MVAVDALNVFIIEDVPGKGCIVYAGNVRLVTSNEFEATVTEWQDELSFYRDNDEDEDGGKIVVERDPIRNATENSGLGVKADDA